MEYIIYIIIFIVVMIVISALKKKKPKSREDDETPEPPVSSYSDIQKAFRLMSDFDGNTPVRSNTRSVNTETNAAAAPRDEPSNMRASYNSKTSFGTYTPVEGTPSLEGKSLTSFYTGIDNANFGLSSSDTLPDQTDSPSPIDANQKMQSETETPAKPVVSNLFRNRSDILNAVIYSEIIKRRHQKKQ